MYVGWLSHGPSGNVYAPHCHMAFVVCPYRVERLSPLFAFAAPHCELGARWEGSPGNARRTRRRKPPSCTTKCAFFVRKNRRHTVKVPFLWTSDRKASPIWSRLGAPLQETVLVCGDMTRC